MEKIDRLKEELQKIQEQQSKNRERVSQSENLITIDEVTKMTKCFEFDILYFTSVIAMHQKQPVWKQFRDKLRCKLFPHSWSSRSYSGKPFFCAYCLKLHPDAI